MALHAFKNQISTILKSNYNICLYLGSFDEHTSSIGADIYLHYTDEEGPLNLWIGDLHINDVNDGIVYHRHIVLQSILTAGSRQCI